ncbi:ABC transporter substrate-binding protein [Streptomyces sp. CRN 30]|uniref:ABC transporter substrate-binding protein n=1 Tax=Streptomyces sp. CRN 30 TaxID=3075613 RepID=UPI002A83984D|nr:ABC transporter substrate-binding protein [Streptomyces sp. CRN 30]
MPSPAGGLVLDLCEKLIDGYARRRGPMPVVVVHATREDPQGPCDDRARQTVDLVHRAQKPRWLLCRRLDPPVGRAEEAVRPPGGPPFLDDRTYAATTALVKDVAEGPWENHNRSQYRPYDMPRSRLLAALDQALAEAADGAGQVPDHRAVVTRLAELRWRPGTGRARTGFWRSLAGLLSPATALGAAVVACVGVLAARVGGWYLTAAVLGALLAPAAVALARSWAGPPWLGAGCRWFATTTFPVTPSREAPVWSPWHPRLSRATLEERAAEVARQLLTAAGPAGGAPSENGPAGAGSDEDGPGGGGPAGGEPGGGPDGPGPDGPGPDRTGPGSGAPGSGTPGGCGECAPGGYGPGGARGEGGPGGSGRDGGRGEGAPGGGSPDGAGSGGGPGGSGRGGGALGGGGLAGCGSGGSGRGVGAPGGCGECAPGGCDPDRTGSGSGAPGSGAPGGCGGCVPGGYGPDGAGWGSGAPGGGGPGGCGLAGCGSGGAGPGGGPDGAGPGGGGPGAAVAADRERARQFCLQLRVLALLEDLRDNHRPAWDLRHRKRTVPPLLLLPRATRDNGALQFLRAVSDVRSRRSEQDPLLIVAGVAHDDMAGLREHTPLPLPALVSGVRDPAEMYQAWVTRSLRTGQAPSMNTALPWLMPLALTGRLLAPYEGYDHPEIRHRGTCRVPRSGWLLWSRWTLVAVCLAATTGAGTSYGWLGDHYCGDVSVVWNRDLVRMPDGQCVGVVSGDRLAAGPGAVTLDADGHVVDLRRLQEAIGAENARIEGERHITLLFAGALTARESDPAEATDVVRQLAGVYLAQRLINDSRATNRLPKVRIVVATGGQGLKYQKRMAERIVDYARRHPDVVGVVGMGINTAESDAAVGLLQRQGLPVIGTTNSATELARKYRNYVGLAPTDQEEAMLLVRSLGDAAGRRAVVLTPDDGGRPGHSYTADHARYGREQLRREGFDVRPTIVYGADDTEAEMSEAVREICDRRVPVVYLAGRASHIPSLMADLEEHPQCRPLHDDLVVLSGDDATKKSYTDPGLKFPVGTLLRYASLTDERHLADAREYDQAKAEFASGLFRPGGGRRPATDGSVYADGFLALSHDAVLAFHTLARTTGVPRSGGAPVVLAALHSAVLTGATGTIGFRDADHEDPQRRGHGIGLHDVTKEDKKAPLKAVPLCGRPAGDDPPFTELCPAPDPA